MFDDVVKQTMKSLELLEECVAVGNTVGTLREELDKLNKRVHQLEKDLASALNKDKESEWRALMKKARDDALAGGLNHVPIPYGQIGDRDAFHRWWNNKIRRTIWAGKVGHKMSPPDVACVETVFPPEDHPKDIKDFD